MPTSSAPATPLITPLITPPATPLVIELARPSVRPVDDATGGLTARSGMPALSTDATPAAMLASALAASGIGPVIELWLQTRAEGSPHTLRAYRREALRYVLWLAVERGNRVSTATLADCLAYRAFLANPVPAERWCGPRGPEAGSDGWRPFQGPLSVGARRQAVVILTCFHRFLQDQGMVHGNPWSAVRTPRHAAPRIHVGRSLTVAQWAAVQEASQDTRLSASAHDGLQLRWVVAFLHATGLRRSEMTAARAGDLRWIDLGPESDAGDEAVSRRGGWVLDVVGKGRRQRQVPVPGDLVAQAGELLAARGLRGGLADHGDKPLLVAWCSARGNSCNEAPRDLPGMSDRGLARKLKQVFAQAARTLEHRGRLQDAQAVRQASVHWLRHTHANHALENGVPLDVVQQGLGHVSLATTTVYVRAQMDRSIREAGRLTGRRSS